MTLTPRHLTLITLYHEGGLEIAVITGPEFNYREYLNDVYDPELEITTHVDLASVDAKLADRFGDMTDEPLVASLFTPVPGGFTHSVDDV